MRRIRFVVVGGFLGAGKTTLLARWAHYLQSQGKRVAIVTNDQAVGLVDTYTLRQQGFPVGEVPGACFCCKFHDLVHVAKQLTQETAPDVVLAEPVGSCTDIQATVIEPLRHLHYDQFELAPFVVLLKPEHGQRILGRRSPSGFSPQAVYIFLKQLEEADVIVLNKIDKFTAAQLGELTQMVQERIGDKPLFALSARTGEGCQRLFSFIEEARTTSSPALDIDYDTYAEGEAALGWLNAEASVGRDQPFALDDLLMDFMKELCDRLAAQRFEPAHLKVYVESGGDAAVANWVSSDVPPELSVASGVNVGQCQMVINARVVAAPEVLEEILRGTLHDISQWWGVRIRWANLQRFRPARPVPTIRWTEQAR